MPAQTRQMVLQFSGGGLNRKASYRQTPPYASRRMKNVRVEEPSTHIMRGGQRPGLKRAYSTQFGSGALVNLIGKVSTATGGGGGSGRYSFTDSFDRDGSDLGGEWETPSWLTQQPATAQDSSGKANNSNPDSAGGILTNLSYNTSSAYTIEMELDRDIDTPYTLGGTWEIYAMLDTSSPDLTKEGIAVVFTVDQATGNYSGVLLDVNNYVVTAYALATGTIPTYNSWGTLKVTITSNNVKVYLNSYASGGVDSLLLDQNVTAKSGTGVGFALNPGSTGETTLINYFSILGTPASPRPNQLRQDVMVIASGGNVYYENSPGSFTQVSGASVESGHTLQCAEMFQKLYVADHNTSGTGKVYVFDPSGPSWSTLTATAGSVPTNCPLIARWHGRLVLASTHLWYMCALNDPTNWQYGRPTATTAVASQNSEAGNLGEPIRALCPASDDLLLFGCENSVWALHGDPAWHGRLQQLSENVGVLDKFAWCFGPASEMYFLSKDGLYVVPPGGNSRPEPLSREKIPDELLSIDTAEYEVNLGWCQAEHGVYITVTSYERGSGYFFFYAPESGTFWQDEFSLDHQPFRLFDYKPIYGKYAALIFGCRDGYLRKIDLNTSTDDGTAIDSYIDIGPIIIAGDGNDGLVRDLDGYLAYDSGDVTWSIYVDETAEGVFGKSAFTSGTWSGGGLQYREHPRARGQAMLLRLGSSGYQGWSIEKVVAIVERLGVVRKD